MSMMAAHMYVVLDISRFMSNQLLEHAQLLIPYLQRVRCPQSSQRARSMFSDSQPWTQIVLSSDVPERRLYIQTVVVAS
jgi:hypothetical protein